jgi:bleomycin hydrolase
VRDFLNFFGVAAAVAVVAVASAQEVPRDTAYYTEKTKDPVIEEMQQRDEDLVAAATAETERILAEYRAAEEERTEPEMRLRFDVADLVRPDSPDAFTDRAWHFPPTPQYLTGTCWSFSATSFMESEIKRLHDREIKLSEMWTAYWEFVNKARGYIASRGESLVDHGSETAALMRVYAEHGVVPRSAYEGVLAEDGRFDHDLMVESINSFLEWCRANNLWDEDVVVAMVRSLLDRTMGRPPETVEWEGRTFDPKKFLSDVCGLDPSDYVSVMSTLQVPFYTRGEYRVPDNWWHDASYVNVPLDVFFDVILRSITAGRSLVIGGDVSEPGMYGEEDIAVVPSFDIPAELIDQSARELRFANGTTTDDHGIHLVGHMELDGHHWFLIKDSNRSSRHGRFEGYYFYRDDYVRLKMLTITVHRDLVGEILARTDGEAGGAG